MPHFLWDKKWGPGLFIALDHTWVEGLRAVCSSAAGLRFSISCLFTYRAACSIQGGSDGAFLSVHTSYRLVIPVPEKKHGPWPFSSGQSITLWLSSIYLMIPSVMD